MLPTGRAIHSVQNRGLRLAALFITPNDQSPAPVETASGTHAAQVLAQYSAATVWRTRFPLPANGPSSYRWDGQEFDVAGDLSGEMRLVYAHASRSASSPACL
ncbi:MAG: hypothetical protein ACOCXK_02760, partial [Rhodosalinus sp.]